MAPNFIFHLKNRQQAINNRFYDIFIPNNTQENVSSMLKFSVVQKLFERIEYLVHLKSSKINALKE